jgi:hypothetical protein
MKKESYSDWDFDYQTKSSNKKTALPNIRNYNLMPKTTSEHNCLGDELDNMLDEWFKED